MSCSWPSWAGLSPEGPLTVGLLWPGGVVLGPTLLAHLRPGVYLGTRRAPGWALQVTPTFAQETSLKLLVTRQRG